MNQTYYHFIGKKISCTNVQTTCRYIATEKNREIHLWITIILYRNNLQVTRPIKNYLILNIHNIKYTLVLRISQNVRKFYNNINDINILFVRIFAYEKRF